MIIKAHDSLLSNMTSVSIVVRLGVSEVLHGQSLGMFDLEIVAINDRTQSTRVTSTASDCFHSTEIYTSDD